MAIQYVGGNSGGGAANVNITVSLTALTGGISSSVLAGDIVVVVLACGTAENINSTIVSPTGFNNICNIYANDSNDTDLAVFWKVMGSTPDTSVITNGNAGSSTYRNSTLVYVFRGVDTINPIDVTTTTATGADGNQADSPSITPITTGALVLSVGASAHPSAQNPTATAPSGYSNMVSLDTNLSGRAILGAISSKFWSGSGAENPTAYSISPAGDTSTSWCAATVALRPAATVANTTNFFQYF